MVKAIETGVVRDGILDADKDIEVLLMNIADEENINKEFLNASSPVIFGTPCYVARNYLAGIRERL